jgi:hypothetical protein
MTDLESIPVRRIQVWVCDLCLAGEGGECHVPGCAFWCHDAPTGDAVAWWQGMRERTPSDAPKPRVWLDGDDVPAGTWVYVLDEDDPEERVHQLDAYEDCRNGNLGPLVEIPLPDEGEAVALAEAEEARRATV